MIVAALGAVGVGIYVVLDNRDPVPSDVLACVRDADLPLNRSSASLNLARQDALSGRLTVARRWDWGRTSGVLLRGAAGDYAVLALWNAGHAVARHRRRRPRASTKAPAASRVVSAETPAARAARALRRARGLARRRARRSVLGDLVRGLHEVALQQQQVAAPRVDLVG